jgi:hypothetical protein
VYASADRSTVLYTNPHGSRTFNIGPGERDPDGNVFWKKNSFDNCT